MIAVHVWNAAWPESCWCRLGIGSLMVDRRAVKTCPVQEAWCAGVSCLRLEAVSLWRPTAAMIQPAVLDALLVEWWRPQRGVSCLL